MTDVMKEYVKEEVKFLDDMEALKNEHGVYIYNSANNIHSINLPYILRDYRQWLIDKKIVEEL